MEYKGYIGKYEYDYETKTFHGTIVNCRDVIHFSAPSMFELQSALVDSVEDYLEFCAQRGEKPGEPFTLERSKK